MNNSSPSFRVLILALSGLGDALMFTPALSVLRRQYPGITIDALVMIPAVKELYEKTGLLNNVIFFDFLKEGAVNSLKKVFELRGKYSHSVSVYPSNRKEYNVIQYLIGAQVRGQVHYKRQDITNLGFLNNCRITEDDKLHNVQHNVRLVGKMFAHHYNESLPLVFPLSESDKQFAAMYTQGRTDTEGKVIIGMHPGCNTLKNHIKRRWAPEKFAALARELTEKHNAVVWLFGGPEEKELREEIISKAGTPLVYAPATQSLSQGAALMKQCALFITNDSGLMHIAAAMGVKTAALIGPTNRFYIHPWQTKHLIISLGLECAPCFFYSPKPLSCSRKDVQYKCIQELSVDFVLRQSLNLLNSQM